MGIDTREASPTDVEALLGLDEMARTDPGRVREALAAAAEHAGLEWVHVDASAALMERFYGPGGSRPTAAGVVWLDDLRATRVP